MLNLILFGPPGSGKGTQAQKLAEKYELLHISTGDLFRHELGNNTPLGQEARRYMDQGKLVPDEITIGMLRNKIEAHPQVKGYIFDGFPRTIPQAEALDKLLAERGQSITALIAIDVPDEEIIQRILLRGKESGRSDDQDEKIIRQRIATYREQTLPVYNYYENQNKAYTINGLGLVEEISQGLFQVIDELSPC